MSLQSHLSQLEIRHRNLEDAIHSATHRPSIDTLEIAAMKKQKLFVRDEIERLRQSV